MTRTLAELTWPVTTERLTLRPARAEDADEVWAWTSAPEVSEWMTTRSADLDAYRARFEEALADTVVALVDGRIVGTGTIRVQDAWSQTEAVDAARRTQAELGWTLDPAVHGRGLGTELAAALRDIAFDGLGVRRVEAGCFAANAPSWRVMEKIGLRREGSYREESLHRSGRWLDAYSYAQLATEHRAGRTGDVATVAP